MGLLGRLLLLVAIALAPAIAIQAYMVVGLQRERVDELHQEAARLGRDASVEVDRIIEGLRDVMIAVSRAPVTRDLDTPACSTYIRDLQPHLPLLATLAVLDADGRVVCHRDPPTALTFADRDYFRDAMARNDLAIGTYLVGAVNRTKVLPLAYPVRGRDGAPIGVVAIAVDLAALSRLLETRALPTDGSITVADRNGIVIARAPYADRFVGTRIPDDFQALVHAPAPGTIDLVSQDGTRRILGYKPVGSDSPAPLYVSSGLAIGPALAALDRAEVRGFALIAAGVFLAVLAAVLGGHYFLRRPLRQLETACRRWVDGEYALAKTPRGVPADLKRLGRVFNGLARSLAEREQERDTAEQALRRTNEQLESAVAARTADLAAANRELSEANRRLTAEIAERAQAEEALRQAQKIEAVGRLTGGVAHDFNNLLTAVLGNLELLQRRLPTDQGRDLVVNAIRAAERGARLTEQLLAFARKQHLALKPIDVNEVVGGMGDLLQRTIGGTVRIETAADPALWPATADPNQLELVILNLAINARDAMPLGGVLRIETANRRVDRTDAVGELAPGDYVAITVADSGTGMAPEVLAKAFEPFFTTKGPGKGSGLGLSQVWGVARQSGGTVAIQSIPGDGTAVTVLLPRAAQALEDTVPDEAVTAPTGTALAILLVDDDPDVRDFTRSALETMGHAVTAADSGREALQRLDDGIAVDLLVVDFAMPGMNGAAVAVAARERRPALPVLFLTGYAEAGVLDDWAGRAGILQKPFKLSELAQAVDGSGAGKQKLARSIPSRP